MSKFLTNIDLNGNELQNVVIHNLGSAPFSATKKGGLYFDSSTGVNKLKYANGSEWVEISVGPSGTWQPADGDLTAIAALSGTSGFLIKTAANTWSLDTSVYLTSSTGVVSVNGANGVITGIAVTGTGLSQFASTTSAELATVLSDETGYSTGAKAVFSISPSITTSITTASTSFDLVNTTATTVNFAGAATSVNIGASNSTTTIAGDLVVNGTTTTINSTTLTVDDKNLELGTATGSYTPSDAGADGGGITLKGTTDKTINYINSTASWTLSENLDLASGKVLKIAGTQVLSASQYTGNALTATTATNVTGGAAGSIVYQTGSGATSTLALPTTGTDQVISDFRLVGGSSAPAWSARKFSKTLSGSATSYTLTHLLGTADVSVSVYEVATGEVVYADIVNTSTTTTVSFATAPTSNQYRVVILA